MCTDGGGIRGYASLLIIAVLMKYIGEAERSGNYGEPHLSSFCPSSKPHEHKGSTSMSLSKQVSSFKTNKKGKPSLGDEEGASDPEGLLPAYLPCHYFGRYFRDDE